jgi:hypothetical protein
MGRKGIGKLSLFAIAKTIQVETAKDGTMSGLVMRADDIRAQMQEKEGEYHPDPLPASEISVAAGTRISLSDLRLNPTAGTVTALRRRLARRFSIIGPEHGFEVIVNDEPIKVSDRDFYPKIEYLWSLGAVGDQYEKLCSKALKKKRLSGTVDAGQGWTVSGWVGTVDTQKSITEETNIVPVLASEKLIHEDLLAAVKPAGLFAKYMMGELHADFVDDDKADDIATSDRQSLKEDDPRFAALTAYLRDTVLREVGNAWRDWRRDNALDKARENLKGPETPGHCLDQPEWSRQGCSPWCSPSSNAWSIEPLERSSWRGETRSRRTPRSWSCATRWGSFVAKLAEPASPGRTGR